MGDVVDRLPPEVDDRPGLAAGNQVVSERRVLEQPLEIQDRCLIALTSMRSSSACVKYISNMGPKASGTPGQSEFLNRRIRPLTVALRSTAGSPPGRATSIKQIADREGVTDRYVKRLLDVAFLPSALVEDILDARQPADLTVEKICQNDISWG